MRLVCLNVWVGQRFNELTAFLKSEAGSTDVFCFQEMIDYSGEDSPKPETHLLGEGFMARSQLLKELASALPEYDPYFAIAQDGFTTDDPQAEKIQYGPATFIHRNITVTEQGKLFIYGDKDGLKGRDAKTIPCCMQHLTLEIPGSKLLLANMHGTWWPWQKKDTPDRLRQSRLVREFLGRWNGPAILCGDFNLRPDTESYRMLAAGMRDLNSEYNITDTRGPLFPYENRTSDYMLVSPEINVKSFEVPEVRVSDHLPLVLEFDV